MKEVKEVPESKKIDGIAILGAVLTGLGLLFLGITNGLFGLDWDSAWPVFLILVGLGALLAGSRERSDSGAAAFFVGITLNLIGLFFFLFTAEVFSWSDMDKLWPVFLLSTGIAATSVYVIGDKKAPAVLIFGLLLVFTATVALFILQISSHLAMSKLWPVFVVAVGVFFLMTSIIRGKK